MKKVKYLIIGAGLSGTSFANSIDDDFLIIEKSSEIGGCCKSYRQDGFVWDQGGHFFHTQDKERFGYLLNANDSLKITKQAKIYFENKYIDYPFQDNIDQLSDKKHTKCLSGVKKKKTYKNNNLLYDLYGKFGKPIVNYFLKPYNEKLYCTSLTCLSKDSMGRFFPKPSLDGERKVKQYNQTFYYNTQGVESFLSPIFNKLDKTKVIFNCHYLSIDTKNKIVETNKGLFQYEYLINTSPFDEFYKAIDSKGYSRDYEALKYNKVLVFNIGFDKPAKQKYHWVYYPEKKYHYYRVGFYSNIVQNAKLSVYIEVGLSQNERVCINRMKRKIVSDLIKCNVIDDSYNILSSNYVIIDPAYIHISEESNQIVQKCSNEWKKNGIYLLGRYGKWEYSCMEDSIIGAEDLAQILRSFK